MTAPARDPGRAALRPAAARSRRATLVSVAAGLATAVVILGVGVALFFNPLWVAFAQSRARVDAWTGWDTATIRSVTDSVVAEVFLGPGTFAQQVGGIPVFSATEAGHMADVRRVVLGFVVVILLAVVALVLARRVDPGRQAFWRGVLAGAASLAVGLVAAGIFAVLLFDTAFEIFHRLFFASGTYTFDPATSRLVQLFPETFWMETPIALGVAAVGIAIVVAAVAGRRLRSLRTIAGPGG